MVAPVVHVIGGDTATEEMFEAAGYKLYMGKGKPDLVCFTGGADVSPELYCQSNTHSHTSIQRDIVEVGQFLKYYRIGVPMVGICRGGQFLNVMMGGSMIQHINGHTMGKKRCYVFDHNEDLIGETNFHEDHHQAMVPGPGAKIMAQSVSDEVNEIIYYPNDDVLCFQPHPEWGHKGTRDIFMRGVESLMENA